MPVPRNAAALAVPDELLDDLAERVAVRVAALLAEKAVDDSRWLDADQAAAYLGCARTRVYDLVRREKLVARRDGRRMLFRKSDLDAAVA